ncbi:MAG: hemolysin family protein [Saccharofermentanales bacterium]
MEDGSIIRTFLAAAPSMDAGAFVVDLLIVALLLFINAFFAASEMSIISLNDTKIRRQAEEGDENAQKIKRLTDEPSSFLATIQVGVTLAGFLSSAFAADRFATRLYLLIGIETPAMNSLLIVGITLLMSYFSLVLGELVPKRIAQSNPEALAARVVRVIAFSKRLLNPFVVLLTASTNLILRLLKIDTYQTNKTVTEEEIRMMVDVGRESGSIHEQEKEMIEKIFEFNDKDVSEVMTHRTSLISLDVDSSFDEVVSSAVNEKYTRIPIYEDNIDNIIGILHVKDLLYHAAEGLDRPFSLRHLIRPPYIVPETKPIDAVFRDMQRDRAQLAVVIDEYGGTAGIVTIEDLLEEIVGNMQDEYDEEEQIITRCSENVYEVAGLATLDEVTEIVNLDLPEVDTDTIAGLVIHLLGRIPDERENAVVVYENIQFEVLEMDDKRISRLRITILPETEEEGDTINETPAAL